jgi:hypothetical protein
MASSSEEDEPRRREQADTWKPKKKRGGARIQRAKRASQRYAEEESLGIPAAGSSTTSLRLQPAQSSASRTTPPAQQKGKGKTKAPVSIQPKPKPREPSHPPPPAMLERRVEMTATPKAKLVPKPKLATRPSPEESESQRRLRLEQLRRSQGPLIDLEDIEEFPALGDSPPRSPVALGESFKSVLQSPAPTEVLSVRPIRYVKISIDLHNVLDTGKGGFAKTEYLACFYDMYRLHIKPLVLSYIGLTGPDSQSRRDKAHEFIADLNRRLKLRYPVVPANFVKLHIVDKKTGTGGKADYMHENRIWCHIDDNNKIIREIREWGMTGLAIATRHEKHANLRSNVYSDFVQAFECVKEMVENKEIQGLSEDEEILYHEATAPLLIAKERVSPARSTVSKTSIAASSMTTRKRAREDEPPTSRSSRSAKAWTPTPRGVNPYSPHSSSNSSQYLEKQTRLRESGQPYKPRMVMFWPRADNTMVKWEPFTDDEQDLATRWLEWLDRPDSQTEEEKQEYNQWIEDIVFARENYQSSTGGSAPSRLRRRI